MTKKHIEDKKFLPSCEETHDHGEIGFFREKMLNLDKAQRMAEFFSLLGDANRLRILSVLSEKELCVCDLAHTLKMTESAVSHQLRTLKAIRLVGYEKRGRRVYYRLKDHHVFDLYQSVAEHLDEID